MSNSIAYFYNELNRALIRQELLERVYESAQECNELDKWYIEQMLESRFNTVVNIQLLDDITKHINRNRIHRIQLHWSDIRVHHVKRNSDQVTVLESLGRTKPIIQHVNSALCDMLQLDVDEAFAVTSRWGTYYTLFSYKGSKSYFCIYGDEDKSWGLSLDYTHAEDALQYIKENGADHGRFYKVIDGKGNLYAMGKTGRAF